jgi:hypothetical protein
VNDLAKISVQSLRDVAWRGIRAIAYGYEQTAIRRDRDAASTLATKPFGGHCRLGSKDDLSVAQGTLGFVEPGLRDVGIAIRAIDKIVEGEEDLVVGSEMRIKYHIE